MIEIILMQIGKLFEKKQESRKKRQKFFLLAWLATVRQA